MGGGVVYINLHVVAAIMLSVMSPLIAEARIAITLLNFETFAILKD